MPLYNPFTMPSNTTLHVPSLRPSRTSELSALSSSLMGLPSTMATRDPSSTE